VGMIEFLLLTLVIFLFLNRTKKKRKPRTLDGQLKELITQSSDATSIAVDIKRYLLNTINDNNNDVPKFSEAQILEAQRIIDRAGPVALYWMSDIAAQLAVLSAAQINGLPTNVEQKLGSSATPQAIVEVVVKI
jgi:hypothetical protein